MSNRQRKFRAYDADAELMVYSESHEGDYWFGFQDGQLKAWVQTTVDSGDPTEPPEPGVDELSDVMDWTGLKDKNGKDIYEGDIVEEEPDFAGAIIFRNGCFRLKYRSVPDGWADEYVPVYEEPGFADCEVIGNIHEHPSLLTGGKP